MARPSILPDTSDAATRARAALEAAVSCAAGLARPLEPNPSLKRDLAALDRATVREYLDQVLLGPRPDLGLDRLHEGGTLGAVLPEVLALVGLNDYAWRHKDVWLHTRQVLTQTPPLLHLRWAALLHDVGKPRTRKISDDGEVSFIGHPELGARMFDRIARRERWFLEEPDLYQKIRFLILHHQRPGQYEETWTDSAVRRFARAMGAHLGDLLELSRADMTTRHEARRRKNLSAIDELASRIGTLAAEDARLPLLPTGVGDELMRAFGIPPSRLVGELKRALEAAVEAGELPARAPAEVYVEFVAERKPRFGLP